MDKLYPSPFQPGDRFAFSNKHGSVTLEAVTAPQPVSKIWLKDAPKPCLVSWDVIEQIALITDQVRLQPVMGRTMLGKNSAFTRHATTGTAGWVRVVALSYGSGVPAREQIARDLDNGRNRVSI